MATYDDYRARIQKNAADYEAAGNSFFNFTPEGIAKSKQGTWEAGVMVPGYSATGQRLGGLSDFTDAEIQDYYRLDQQRLADQKAKADAAYNSGSGWLGNAGALAFGVAGAMAGMPMLGGMMAGSLKGLSSSPSAGFDEMVKGGAIGAGTAYAGGQIASGLDSAAGYQPGVSDSIWSESASPMSSWGTQAGIKAGTNYLTGAAKSGINSLFDWSGGGTKPSNINSTQSNLWGSTGGNMADTSISDWAKTLSPFLGAYNTNRQAGNTADTFGKAYDLITTPSPDQQKYRTQLSTLMDNPGSMESSPVYQAMADQGMNAVNRTAAAKGMSGSGNRLAELMKVGQDTASKYYFPQQQNLAQLANVQGDSAQRTLGAGSLIEGQNKQTEMSNSMLKDAMAGFGVESPEQQLINSLLGKSSGGVGGTSVKGVSDWLKSLNPSQVNDVLTQSGSTLDQAQLQDLLNQQDGFNWSGMDGVIGGSQQDQMLYDQWNPDWFSNSGMDTSVNTWGW